MGEILEAESSELADRRIEVEVAVAEIDNTIRNLLDNITAANRAAVDRRLGELGLERARNERELDRLDALDAGRTGLDAAVKDVRAFLRELPALLTSADAETRQAALRRCVASAAIDRERRWLGVEVRIVPACGALCDSLPMVPVERTLPARASRSKRDQG